MATSSSSMSNPLSFNRLTCSSNVKGGVIKRKIEKDVGLILPVMSQ